MSERMKHRELTGIYFRIERDRKWQPVDISDMSGDEIAAIMREKTPGDLISFIILLVGIIRGLGERFNLGPGFKDVKG